jgi:hypothetical protein
VPSFGRANQVEIGLGGNPVVAMPFHPFQGAVWRGGVLLCIIISKRKLHVKEKRDEEERERRRERV